MNRNFNEIYEQIYKNAVNELTTLRRKKELFLAIFIGINIIACVMFRRFRANELFYLIWMILAVATGIYYIKFNLKYKNGYKNTAIKSLVKLYSQNLFFIPNRGIGIREYIMSRFDINIHKMHSEDLIQGKINKNTSFKMSQVKVIKKNILQDSKDNSNSETYVAFSGLFGCAQLPEKLIYPIQIMRNKNYHKYNNQRIEMDSNDFEKTYDVLAKDKIQAMQIFTSELIEKINEFNEYTGFVMELKIDRNKVFFRINCKEVFEAPESKETLDYSVLYKYFKMIDLPINIIETLIRNIEAIEQ